MRGGLCHHPQEVRERFPGDRLLVDLGIESYLGVPLLDGDGRVLGHLAVFDERPMPAEPRRLFIFRISSGRSPALLAVLDKVSRVAPTDATVLITGETGTGKELVARAIHTHVQRAARPFVAVNCAALPAEPGRERAVRPREGRVHRRRSPSGIGRFELADGGTLFLDEIGELPPELQAKLLRVCRSARSRPHRHPRDRPHPRPRDRRRARHRPRRRPRILGLLPRSGRAPPYPRCPPPDPMGHRGPRGAAQILGLHPNTLRSRLKKLGITRSAPEPP